MEFQEFPKWVVKDGDGSKDGRLVKDDAEEKAAKKDGYVPGKPVPAAE